jgi:hypothetical protein
MTSLSDGPARSGLQSMARKTKGFDKKQLTLLLRVSLVFWAYDILKIGIIYDTLVSYDVNPWIFLVLDLVTAPPYILGVRHLFFVLIGKPQGFGTLFKWGAVTFVSSTAPYLYIAWAGHQSFPKFVWIILFLIMIFPFINLIKKIHIAKKNLAGYDPYR